ncbi:MAG TPA: hypothetical protein PKO10_04765, partial [Aliarcobacter cryaerophilus]|nr:hypothetical protein [Aliarcobacter cryaerophilus]
ITFPSPKVNYQLSYVKMIELFRGFDNIQSAVDSFKATDSSAEKKAETAPLNICISCTYVNTSDARYCAFCGTNLIMGRGEKIFEVLKPLHNLDDKFQELLVVSSKLHSVGSSLNFYKKNDNAFEFILNGLNYDFQHTSRVIVAHTIKFSKKSLPKQSDIEEYKELLPNLETMQWLSFMIALNIAVNTDFSCPKVNYILDDDILRLKLPNRSFLINSYIEKLELPKDLSLEIL